MIVEQKKNYHAVNFINLSISALGVFDKESSSFIDMLEHFNLDKAHVRYVIKKIIKYCNKVNLLHFLLSK